MRRCPALLVAPCPHVQGSRYLTVLQDCLNLVVTVKVLAVGQLEKEGGTADLEEAEYKPKPLLPFMKRIPARRVVHLPEEAADPVSFTLSYNSSYPLPSGITSPILAQFDITGACHCSSQHKCV